MTPSSTYVVSLTSCSIADVVTFFNNSMLHRLMHAICCYTVTFSMTTTITSETTPLVLRSTDSYTYSTLIRHHLLLWRHISMTTFGRFIHLLNAGSLSLPLLDNFKIISLPKLLIHSWIHYGLCYISPLYTAFLL